MMQYPNLERLARFAFEEIQYPARGVGLMSTDPDHVIIPPHRRRPARRGADLVTHAAKGNRHARGQRHRSRRLRELADNPILFATGKIQRSGKTTARWRRDADLAGGGIDLDDHAPRARVEAHAYFQHATVYLQQLMPNGRTFFEQHVRFA